MFDGNYRIRRDVNLGGNSRRSRQTQRRSNQQNRTTLLEDTKRQREERRKQQLKERSSKLIQRIFRGYKSRCNVKQYLNIRWNQLQLQLLNYFQQQQQPQQPPPPPPPPQQQEVKSTATTTAITASATFSELTLILSMLLSLPHDNEKMNVFLLEHAKNIKNILSSQAIPSSSSSSSSTTTAIYSATLCSSERISQATLERMMNPQHLSTTSISCPEGPQDGFSTSVSSPEEIMQLHLLLLEYHLSTQHAKTEALQSLSQSQPQSLVLQRLGGTVGSLKLFHCTQQWLWWEDNNYKSGGGSSNIRNTIRDKLWKWTCSLLPLLNDNHDGKAIMGAILFGKKSLLSEKNNWYVSYIDYTSIHKCFHALVQVITTSDFMNTGTAIAGTNPSTADRMRATIHQTLQNRETIVLTNALALLEQQQEEQETSSFSSAKATAATKRAILKFIFHVLKTNPDLALVTSLVVKGDNIETLILPDKKSVSRQSTNITMQQEEDDDLSDEDEADDMTDDNNHTETSSSGVAAVAGNTTNTTTFTTESQKPKKYKSSSSSSPTNAVVQQHRRHRSYRILTKKDLQTVSKLDRTYIDQIQQWRKETLSKLSEKDIKYRQSLVDLAVQIGNANMWLQKLNIASFTGDKTQIIDNKKNDNTGGETDDGEFIGPLLALLMQGVTGVKLSTSASSPFLSQLAFGKGSFLIENLWGRIIRQQNANSFNETTCLNVIVFCDIFAQSLIAMTDDKFLHQYTSAEATATIATTTRTVNATTPAVLAEDIIIRLKGLLHELYWTRPVTIQDIHFAANSCTTTAATSIVAGVIRQQQQEQQEEEYIRALRGRLLLSVTKCWNSLYERWCRLLRRAPFCDESTWWFPHLVTRDGYSAVVDGHDNIINGSDQDDENMFNARTQQRRRRRRQQQQNRQYAAMVLEDEYDENQDNNSVESMDIDSSSEEDDDEMGTSGNGIGGQQSQQEQQNNVDAESEALANSFRDPKMARILTCIPQALPFDRRVRLFHSLLSADKMKTQDEASEVRMAMLMMMQGELDPEAGTPGGRERVEIRRDNLYQDSMRQLNQLGSKLKRKVQVAFINQHGTSEAGIDGGGVFKEFVDDLIRDAFSSADNDNNNSSRSSENNKTNNNITAASASAAAANNGSFGDTITNHHNDNNFVYGNRPTFEAFAPTRTTSTDNGTAATIPPALFSVTPLQTLTVNSAFALNNSILPHYEFLGRVLGKAVYESILVEPQFCLPFLNQLLGKRNSLEDLKNFDLEYYTNIIKLLSLDENEISSLGLTFELTSSYATATSSSNDNNKSKGIIELVPNGQYIPVTKQNVIHYIHLVANHKLNVEGSKQTKAFLRGFRDLIPASWVRLFSSVELQKLIGGDDSIRGIDVQSLQGTIQYAAGYHPSQPIIQWLWEVVDEFTPAQQRLFLKFMTSCSRQPLLGFQSLEPVPCIQQIRLPDDLFPQRQHHQQQNQNVNNKTEDVTDIVNTNMYKNTPLPTSSTCMNLLKLPNYRSKELLRRKLLDAIEAGAGFELT